MLIEIESVNSFMNVTSSDTVLIPRGAVHFEVNLDCEPAYYLSTYDRRKPDVHVLNDQPQRHEQIIKGIDLLKSQTLSGNRYLSNKVLNRINHCVNYCGRSNDNVLEQVEKKNYLSKYFFKYKNYDMDKCLMKWEKSISYKRKKLSKTNNLNDSPGLKQTTSTAIIPVTHADDGFNVGVNPKFEKPKKPKRKQQFATTEPPEYDSYYDDTGANINMFNEYYDIERIRLRTTPVTPRKKTTKKSKLKPKRKHTTTTVSSDYEDYLEYSDTNSEYQQIRLKTTAGTPREASMVKGLEKTTKPYSDSKLPGHKSTTRPPKTTPGPDDDSFVEAPGRSTPSTNYETSYDYSETYLNQFNNYYDIEKMKLKTTPGTPREASMVKGLEKTTKKADSKLPGHKSTTSPSKTTLGPDDDSFVEAPGRSTTPSTDYEASYDYSESNLNQYNEFYQIENIKLRTTPGTPGETSMVKGLEKTTKKPRPTKTTTASSLQDNSNDEYSESIQSQYNEFYDMAKIRLRTTPGTPNEMSIVK